MYRINEDGPRMLALQFVRAVQEAAEKDYERACRRKMTLPPDSPARAEAEREAAECERFFRSFYSSAETEALCAHLQENARRHEAGLPRLKRKHDRGISRRMRTNEKEAKHDA